MEKGSIRRDWQLPVGHGAFSAVRIKDIQPRDNRQKMKTVGAIYFYRFYLGRMQPQGFPVGGRKHPINGIQFIGPKTFPLRFSVLDSNCQGAKNIKSAVVYGFKKRKSRGLF